MPDLWNSREQWQRAMDRRWRMDVDRRRREGQKKYVKYVEEQQRKKELQDFRRLVINDERWSKR